MSDSATARRRVAASAGRGPLARWARRRLFAAAARGEPAALDGVVEIAGRPSHRHRERARKAIAAWWVQSRDPLFRRAVLETGAVAAEDPERLQTHALLGRLSLDEPDACWMPVLLGDGDPDVRERAAAFCLAASGPLLRALWDADTGPDTPLRSALLAHDETPSRPTLDRLWGECLRAPGDVLLDTLVRWGRPASGGPEKAFSLVALKKDPGVPHDQDLAERLCEAAMADPRLVWICKEHGFAPKEPVRRAVFFLLTGQPEQYRALDPDGGLLALAYASASSSDGERARIREAMLAAGELDLVRVVAGDRRARISAMSDGEARYLGEQLAERGEWEELWTVVQDLPLATGCELFGLFGEWAPRDDDSRRVFEMFRETGPGTVAIAVRSMQWYWISAALQATFHLQGGVNDLSLAPDGPFLAAAGGTGVAGVFDLRTGGLVQRYDGFASPAGRVLHTGDGTLIVGEHAGGARVVRCTGEGMRTLHRSGPVTSLALTGEDGSFAAGTRDGRLLLGAADDDRVDARHVTTLGMAKNDWPRATAAHRGSGRLAVLGRRLALTVPATRQATAVSTGDQRIVRARFTDADTLICADRHGTVTRLRGPRWHRTARTHYLGLGGLGALPRTARAVVVDLKGDLHFLDAESLATENTYRAPVPREPTGLTVSPNGDFAAVSYPEGHIDLFDLRVRELPDLLTRPMADSVPRDLSTIATALTHTGPLMTPATLGTLRLLHACLEHRFRYDIEIGDAAPLTAGQYDISL